MGTTSKSRDRELVSWVARLGAVELRHVCDRFGVGRSVAYDLVTRSARAGLLERLSVLRGEPSLIRATEDGIELSGLGLPVAKLSAGQFDHWRRCADVAIWAERQWGAGGVISERELRFLERIERVPIASAIVGELPDGSPRLHRPDLVVIADERPIAIEVELTPKAPARLRAIVKGWRRSRHVKRVIYLCPAGPTQQAVERAVREVHADSRVSVEPLERISEWR
jgi:hypothetical protein